MRFLEDYFHPADQVFIGIGVVSGGVRHSSIFVHHMFQLMMLWNHLLGHALKYIRDKLKPMVPPKLVAILAILISGFLNQLVGGSSPLVGAIFL